MADALSASIFVGETVSGGTSGSVLFIDANLHVAQNNAKFIWDNTNGTLVIGAANGIVAGPGLTYLKFPNLDSNVVSSWSVSQGWFGNTNPGHVRDDTMFFVGYNVNPTTGGPLLAGEPLWAWHLETYETSTDPGVPYVEGHLTFISSGAVSRRPFDCRINLNTNISAASLASDRTLLKDSASANVAISAVITTGSANSHQVGIGGNANANAQFHVFGTALLQSLTAAADNKYWEMSPALGGSASDFAVRAVNDAYTVANVAFYASRSGATVSSLGFRILPNANATHHFLSSIFLIESAAGSANNKYWDISHGAGDVFVFRAVNDAYGAAGTVYTVNRTGVTVNSFVFGTTAQAFADSASSPGWAWAAETNMGWYRPAAGTVSLSIGSAQRHQFTANTYSILHDSAFILLGAGSDARIARDAANVIAIVNGAAAQELRVYGAAGIYASLKHDGTNLFLTQSGGKQIAFATAVKPVGDTTGYLCLPASAGAPTGVPANIPSGSIPYQIDSTNKKLYAYIGGAWLKAQVTAVDMIFG